jgi:hypothetical protein
MRVRAAAAGRPGRARARAQAGRSEARQAGRRRAGEA